MCYIERTIQLFWLSFKVGMFTETEKQDSIIFRLHNEGKEHYQLQMIKIKHRLKISALILMQLGNEDALVMKFKQMDHFNLISLRVSITEAIQSSEFIINTTAKVE